MEDQEFINQLAEKLSKLGTVRPLGFHYLHPYGTVPADSIICNGATYSRALYKDFFDYITTQGWVKTEAEWQEIATRDNGFCPFYSSGDGSTNFRTPKFSPFMQIAIASDKYGKSNTVQPESNEWVVCVVAYGIATNVGSVDIQNVMSAVNAVQADVESIQANMPPRSSVYVKEVWKSGTEWCRIFSDGWIEQGGILEINSGTVSFHKGFSNTNYTFLHTPNLSGMAGQWFAWEVSLKTTTSIKISMIGGAGTTPSSICWVAYGY